tara:strand:- start:748 stop:2865 length:2118 start_codon:yes stop_codon:yes gene_type:complete
MFLNNKKVIIINLYFFVISFLLVLFYLGIENLSIYNFDWLFYGDASSDIFNWLTYKNSNWKFPIGNFEVENQGINSIVFTGAVPLFSIISKFFFKNFENFHFFNIWLFACFYLQYLFSFLILNRYYKNYFSSILGGLFFILSPILINRFGLHLSLGAHWILLAYFYIKITYQNNSSKTILIICFSSLIHFYFTMMLLLTEILYNIFINEIYKKKNIQNFLKFYSKLFVSLFLVMYAIGYFSIPIQDTLGYGYGVYKLNLLSPINPLGYNLNGYFNWSNFLPQFELNFGENEGFNYFGLGYLIMFSLFILNFKSYFFHEIKKKGFILIIFLITVFSLSNQISFGKTDIININLYKFVEAPLSLARASGRFFWIVYYLLLFCCLINLKNLFQKKYKIILIILLSIQIIDLIPGYKRYFQDKAINQKNINLEHELWNKIISNQRIISSTYIKNQSNDFFKILTLSKKNGFLSEIHYFARYDREALLRLRYKNYEDFYNNNLNKKKVYLINNLGHANYFKNKLQLDSSHKIVAADNILLLIDKELISNISTNDEILSKINSKVIKPNYKYTPKFIEDYSNPSFLGIGWTKHGFDPSARSDGDFSSLFFDLSELKSSNYNLIIKINGIINKADQKLSIEINDEHDFEKKIFLDIKDKTHTFEIPLNLNKIEDINNYTINFKIKDQLSEFDTLKSPDKKKLGFKIDYIQVN